jgi:ubiquinol-cytochrome c reductase iron-sulfur subunit
VRRAKDWLLTALVLAAGRARPTSGRADLDGHDEARPRPVDERVVPPGPPAPRAELVVVALLALAALASIGFVAVYAIDRLGHQTQLLGLCLGGAFILLAAACIVASRHLVVSEELDDPYPEPAGSPHEQEYLVALVEQSGSRITRRGLLGVTAAGALGALAVALVVPAASLGPLLHWGALARSPWRRGRRLVDESGKPLRADTIEFGTFYTAYPEGADREDLQAPVLVVRLQPEALALPADRRGWAPQGILAYSKICTHAGCAISLYRTPLFEDTEPKPAFVCPCHYSTFDPATGGTVTFGPAGRPLPQLPLQVGRDGTLQSAGPLSEPAGPSWLLVRTQEPST